MTWRTSSGQIVEDFQPKVMSEPGIYDRKPAPRRSRREVETKTIYVKLIVTPVEVHGPTWEQVLAGACESGAFEFLDSPEEDLYTRDDGEPI